MKSRVTRVVIALITLAAVVHSGSIAGKTRSRTSTAKPAATAAKAQHWRVGEPVKFENLTIYPVLSTIAVANRPFITLDEGLKTGKVTVSEIGANGRAHRIRAGQEASDSAEVNTLLVTNRSGKTLLLIAGVSLSSGETRIAWWVTTV